MKDGAVNSTLQPWTPLNLESISTSYSDKALFPITQPRSNSLSFSISSHPFLIPFFFMVFFSESILFSINPFLFSYLHNHLPALSKIIFHLHHETNASQTYPAKTARTQSRASPSSSTALQGHFACPPQQTSSGTPILGGRICQGRVQGSQGHRQPAPHSWLLDAVAGLLAEHRRRKLERGKVDTEGVGQDVARASGPAL